MKDQVVLGQLKRTRSVVESFLLRDGTFLVVEPEQVRRAVYSSELKYEQMDIVVTAGYNCGASIYWEPLTGVEYLILLKDCGAIELLSCECRRIDLIETGMEQDDVTKFFAFDERDNQIFINLNGSAIYSIEYQLKNKVMYFIKRDGGPRCIYEDADKIIGMEISWNIDYVSGRDFPTISILSQNEYSQERHFQVIRQTPMEVRKKRQPWETFIGHSKLDIKPEDHGAVLRAISNVGFFVFCAKRILFIKLPGGYEQTIKDKDFEQFDNFESVSMEYESLVDDEINLNGGILLRRNINSLEFAAFTSKNYLLRIWLKVIFEDPDDLIYHWDSLSLEQIQIDGFTSEKQIITRTIFLSSVLIVLLLESDNITIFLDLNQLKVVKVWSYNSFKVFYSDIIGTDFRKLVNCGGSASKEGYIESKFWGHSNFFLPVESFISKNKVLELWNNDSGIWWKDTRGQIFCNGKYVDSYAPPTYISSTGSILKDTSIIACSDILNDPNGNYVYVSKEGYVGWSDETNIVTLDKLRNSSLVKYTLACTKLNGGSKVTVISVDNRLTILNGTNTLKKEIDLTNELESITSICVVNWHGSLRLLITDIDGKLCELDVDNSKIQSKHKVGAHRAEICAVTDRDFFLLYTKDDLMLMQLTDMDKFEITRVDMKSRISKIAAKDGSAIAILDDDFKIHQYAIPREIPLPHLITKRINSDSYVHTKFISLSCSTRYIITSSFRSEYSNLLKRVKYYAEIQLHDLEKQKTVFQYDLSKNYPQALVSDMVPLPFNRESFLGDGMNPSNLYAMQLAFDRVFVVSMNYEMSEDESLDNVLLFSLDDSNEKIEFLQGIKTGHPISALLNYHNGILFTASEVLQAYKIDYLLKENTFKIELVSNDVRCGGLVKTIARFPQEALSRSLPEGKRRKLQHSEVSDKLLVHNILRGPQEYTMIRKAGSTQETLQITPVVTSEKSSFWDNPNLTGLITHFSIYPAGEITWLAAGTTDRSISLYCVPGSDEPSLIQLKLPGDIVGICSLSKSHESSRILGEQSLIQKEIKPISILFAINTSKGEYLIGTLNDNTVLNSFKTIITKKMGEQFEFIQLEDEQSNLNFIDTRVLAASSLEESFERAVL